MLWIEFLMRPLWEHVENGISASCSGTRGGMGDERGSGLFWVIEVIEKGWCTPLTDSKQFMTSPIAVDRVFLIPS